MARNISAQMLDTNNIAHAEALKLKIIYELRFKLEFSALVTNTSSKNRRQRQMFIFVLENLIKRCQWNGSHT